MTTYKPPPNCSHDTGTDHGAFNTLHAPRLRGEESGGQIMKAKAFFSTRFRMAAIVFSGLLLLALYLGGLSAQASPDLEPAVEVSSAAPQMAPIPVVMLNVPDPVLLGETFVFSVTLQNTPSSSNDEGYFPFVDVVLDRGGADLATPCDGIDFVSAEMVGVNGGPLPLTPNVISTAPCGSSPSTVAHPYSELGLVTLPPGAKLLTIAAPFGSYEPKQPPIVIEITALVHNFADVNTPLNIYARGGFRYGDDPLNNPTTDPPILSHPSSTATSWLADETTPTLFTLKKEYLGPENENANGPNFVGYYPLQYKITLDIAAGQTITDVVVTDTLPNNMAFVGVISTVPAPIPTTPTLPPADSIGATLVWEFGTLTGAPPANTNPEVTILFEFYVPKEDANGNPILDPNTCDPVESINDVKATGLWEPLDPRDVGPVTVVSDITNADHILLDKCLAIQKSVTIADDTGADGATPGDILEYRLKFQASDFFTFGELAIEDNLSDGQLLITTPTLTVSDQFGTISGTFTTGDNFFKTADPGLECGIVQGGTSLKILVSQAMQNLAGPPPLNAGILTGGYALLPTTTTPAIGEIVFYVEIQDEFDFPHPGDEFVDKHDPMNNCVTIQGEVLTNVSNQSTGVIAEDDSQTSISIVHGILSKEVYAINGAIPPSSLQVAAGDDITFRITYDKIPSSDAEALKIEDYFPQPVLDVNDPDANTIPGPSWTQGGMNAGEWMFASGDTCHLLPALPTVIIPNLGSSNSLLFDYGNFNDPTNTPCVIDLLFTLTVTSKPYADGLLMTNEVVECENNTFEQTFCQVAVAQFELTEPELKITKGLVWTDNPHGTFIPDPVAPPPVTFGAPTNCPRFTGTINSGGLSTTPIISNLHDVDAGDKVTYAMAVENLGSGLHGAFDVEVEDTLPAGFTFVPGSLCVTDGTGAPISYGGSLFPGSITLDDPSIGTTGALAPYDPTSGLNIAIITYGVLIDEQIEPNCYTNQAELLNYATIEGGPDFVSAGFVPPFEDEADVCIKPDAEKSIVTTSEAHTTPDNSASGTPKLTIGEIVRYRLQVRLPEGVSPNFALQDNLPADLVYLDDGTATVAFVSDAGIASTTIAAAANVAGDESTVDSMTPTHLLLSSDVNGGPFGCATPTNDPIFQLGTLTNSDFDSNLEFVVLEFNALVCNTSANNNGNSKSNQFSVAVDGQSVATSNSVSAQIVEPSLTVSKDVVSATVEVGGTVVYQITVQNTGTATAFEVQINDSLPICLVDLQVLNIDNPTGGAVDILDSSTGSSLDVNIAELPVGDQVVIEIAVQVDCLDCGDLENTVNVSYTSLLGVNGTVPNPTGSTTPGASGDPDGERNRSGGVNDYITEASAPLCGEICGVKFHDLNRNGVQDANEPTLAGWLIEIRDAAGNLTSVTTDANGEYCTQEPFDSFIVSEEQQNGWSQTTPTAPGNHTVTLDPTQLLVQGIDFGNAEALCTSPPTDMVAWWHFDESTGPTAADIAMYNNKGWHVNGPLPVPGMVAGALSFNGQNQYVHLVNHPELNFGAAISNTVGDFSIDAWIQTSQNNGVQIIVDKYQQWWSLVRGYSFFVGSNGTLGFRLANGTGFTNYTSGPTVNVADGEWHHVAVTIDRDNTAGGVWYVDGVPTGGTFDPTTHLGSLSNSRALRIARRFSSSTLFNGSIDEVELFNRVLTPSEVWNLYNANSAGKCKEPDLALEKSHVGHFEPGGLGTYLIDVTNVGTAPASAPITVIDTLPSLTTYLSGGGSGWSCPAGPISAPGPVTCTYTGPPPSSLPSLPLAPGQSLPSLVINIQLNDTTANNCAMVNEVPNETNLSNNEDCDEVQLIENFYGPDLGDAPDSTNHYSNTLMSAYSPWTSPLARYPTVYDTGTGSPPGPMHNNPEADAFLGSAVSQEEEADQPLDQDGITNIDPSIDSANRDGLDDGVRLNTVNLPRCRWTRFQYDAKVVGAAGPRKVNVWFDFNQDGDWEDMVWCQFKQGPVSFPVLVLEWAVRNHTVNLTPGNNSKQLTPYFWATRPHWYRFWKQGMWMRVTLTGENDPRPCFGPGAFGPCLADGQGPVGGYEYGETEDYRIYPRMRVWPVWERYALGRVS